MIIPLYARKLSTNLFPELFQDPLSEKLISKLDYDFSVIEKKSRNTLQRFGALEVAMRQSDIATEVKKYLTLYPQAAVVNLGCGLDQTGENCDNGKCKIYNIDFPDVIDVRNKLIKPSSHITNIPANLNDFSWFKKIDASNGAIFFAAGVFYYFTKDKVQMLFNALNNQFKNAKLVFDTAGKRAVKLMIKTWIKQAEIKDVNAYFYVDNMQKDLLSWSNGFTATYKGYMLGYQIPEGKNVTRLHKFLSKVGDRLMKMKIIVVSFK